MKLSSLFLVLTLLTSSFAYANCEDGQDWDYTGTVDEWAIYQLKEQSFIDRYVTSKIGNFRLEFDGAIYQRQERRIEMYTCRDHYGTTQKKEGDSILLDSEDSYETVEQVYVTFPNGYKIYATDDEIEEKGFRVEADGLREEGPFAPVGGMADKDAILAIGKLKLKASDYTKLQKSF